MKKKSTLLRYFISYFIILLFLLTSFIVIIQTQLVQNYSRQLNSNVEKRLSIIQEQLSANYTAILQMDSRIKDNASIINYRYKSTDTNRRSLYQFLSSSIAGNEFIDAIIYINKNNGDILSTNYHIEYRNDLCYIYNGKAQCEVFNLPEIENRQENTLIFPTGTNPTYYIYVSNNVRSDFSIIYLLKLNALEKTLKNNMINGIDALVITSTDTSQIYGIHSEKIMTAIHSIPTESGNYECDRNYSLYVQSGFFSKHSLVALFSNQSYTNQIQDAFRTAYTLLFLIGLTGFLMIFFSMKITYSPLAKLVQKVLPQYEPSQSYIKQLDAAFSVTITEKALLQEKINKYHQSILNSLLESSIDEGTTLTLTNLKTIDHIFRADCDNCIYMLRIHFNKKQVSDVILQHLLDSALPAGSPSVLLESGSDYRVYLVNCLGKDPEKETMIYSLMTALNSEWGCYCALSNSVSSLTSIPSLYENTLLASKDWPDCPVASYSKTNNRNLTDDSANTLYPYQLLDRFNESLKILDFTTAQELLANMLAQIDSLIVQNSDYPGYIIRCLLVDILMTLFASLNHHDIKFKLYSELFFETLYYCRSYNWQEKKQEITENLLQLLGMFQEERNVIRINQIQTYINENYTSEELTITTLADHFHVSIFYMSNLFKKELGENFVDYIWKLRFEKACDMLLNTNLSIDTISAHVGYSNTTSFRRKFKQESGMTPSQFRAK